MVDKKVSEDYMKGYLAGMLDGEGSVSYSGISAISNTNKEMIDRVSSYLSYFGIKHSVLLCLRDKRKDPRIKSCKPIWNIRLSEKSNIAKYYLLFKNDCTKSEKIKSWLNGEIRIKLRDYYRIKSNAYNKKMNYKSSPEKTRKDIIRNREKGRSISRVSWAMKRWF